MKIVIIGAGFAGLNAAKSLAKLRDVQITIIDRHNYHLFQPLLYQVATAGLNPADIATPIRAQLSSYKNIEVVLDEVISINRDAKTVLTKEKSLQYDRLIVATGAKNFYFGQTNWPALAPGLKGLEDATEIRRRLFLAFENAEKTEDEALKKKLMTFVLIGAGPTGVELAGAFAEIAHQVLTKDFRHINPQDSQVILIEAGPRILPSFNEKMSLRAQKDLEAMGVTVRTNTKVIDITSEAVILADGKIETQTIAWSAGVTPSPLAKTLGVVLDRRGRVPVDQSMSLKEDSSVFVLGDLAAFEHESVVLPGVASVAIQQGRFMGKIISADLLQKERPAFKYLDKGQMATIGRKKAVLQIGSISFGGTLAWYAWLFVHLYYLIGFRNRFMVFLQWAWSYITFKRGARIITPPRTSEDN
tara:strand:+ start:4593 stop:5840 length:1248 start_codon:yes stop_codon:yes gene_type:complete